MRIELIYYHFISQPCEKLPGDTTCSNTEHISTEDRSTQWAVIRVNRNKGVLLTLGQDRRSRQYNPDIQAGHPGRPCAVPHHTVWGPRRGKDRHNPQDRSNTWHCPLGCTCLNYTLKRRCHYSRNRQDKSYRSPHSKNRKNMFL